MGDASESPYSVITERLRHPVFGVFTLIWFLSNWRIPFFLYVDTRPAAERINEALVLYGSSFNLVYVPTGITLAYVLTSPLAKSLALRYERFVANRDAVDVYKSELAFLQNKASLAAQSNEELDTQLKDLASQIEAYRKELKELTERRDGMRKGVKAMLELTDPDWKSPLRESESIMRPARRDDLMAKLMTKFALVEKLKEEILKGA